MGVKLTHASRTELADSLRQPCQSSSGKTKKLILSEFITSTGYHPKYALHLLNAADTPSISDHRLVIGRASTMMRHALQKDEKQPDVALSITGPLSK